MTAGIGKQVRLGRILPGAGRKGACFAADHGMQLGPIPGLADLRAAIRDAAEAGFDAVILSPGGLAACADLFANRDAPAAILRLDQTTMWRMGGETGYEEGHTRLVASVEDAVRMGAEGVITYFFVGHRDPALEDRMFEIAGAVARRARELGVVYVAEPMAAREGLYRKVFDGAVVAANARMAIEIGADIVKCDWAGSVRGCRQVVAAAMGAPVMIAGGPRQGGAGDTVALVGELLEGGANGVMFGRSLFQDDDRRRLMRIVREMIHEGLSAEEAKARLGEEESR